MTEDPRARQAWDEATSALADGLLVATALLAPGAVVLGGGLAEAGDQLVEPVHRAMVERSGPFDVPPVHVATLGGRAGLHGAALVARRGIAGVAA